MGKNKKQAAKKAQPKRDRRRSTTSSRGGFASALQNRLQRADSRQAIAPIQETGENAESDEELLLSKKDTSEVMNRTGNSSKLGNLKAQTSLKSRK